MPAPLPPELPLHCPYCGVVLVFVRASADTQFYRCLVHGLLMLPPDGRMRQVPA